METKEQQKALYLWERFSDNMLSYVMGELQGYAQLGDKKTGIQWGPYKRVYFSDSLMPKDIPEDLKAAVKHLEESTNIDDIFISKRFQWLPSDFAVDSNGDVRLPSLYINNILPKHQELVPVIERVMEGAIPLWETVLSALRRGPVPMRHDPDRCDSEGHDAYMLRQLSNRPLTLPDSPSQYTDSLAAHSTKSVSLKRSNIQAIAKLANIILTPDKPEYPGGIRHVERMTNECIVSTFIYYYEADNIEPYGLGFRMAVQQPDYMLQHLQDDDTCQEVLDQACIQHIGAIRTQEGRCVAFPDLYQHRESVSPFKLADPTKPGSWKILVFFLVDLMCHIHSSTNIPPQQFEIVKEIFRLQGILEYLLDESTRSVPGVMSRAEAESMRDELMKERSLILQSSNHEFFERVGHISFRKFAVLTDRVQEFFMW
ncbi:hypothetical protein C8J56DRAFT_1004582 [Mycena floridula]|nr:hypothetical protein C8J56DRAFT_1004582 [Mycena floridula]